MGGGEGSTTILQALASSRWDTCEGHARGKANSHERAPSGCRVGTLAVGSIFASEEHPSSRSREDEDPRPTWFPKGRVDFPSLHTNGRKVKPYSNGTMQVETCTTPNKGYGGRFDKVHDAYNKQIHRVVVAAVSARNVL